jgi:anaphase-promoting complex subunit 1
MSQNSNDRQIQQQCFFDTQQVISLRFHKDLRIKEVERLLSSHKPVTFQFTRNLEISDHDMVTEQQTLLLHVAQRTLALPVGRGCFTYSSEYPQGAGIFPSPPLNISCKLRPGKGIIEFHSGINGIGPEFPIWPEFHNGVATALSIHSAKTLGALDPSWIASQEPLEPTNNYAGMLLGLGLCGHLSRFEPLLLYRYLGANHQLTTIGTLLGAAMSHRGTENMGLTKIISLHVPAMLVDISSELKTDLAWYIRARHKGGSVSCFSMK